MPPVLSSGCWDHPRACGEHRPETNYAAVVVGSSPRLRGTRFVQTAHENALGIIPALAGNTTHCRNTRQSSWDHPRACGEHCYLFPCRPVSPGSSPRLRGTPYERILWQPLAGIIPALAGNTTPVIRSLTASRDHPRACGEHVASAPPSHAVSGSSPRLRGTHLLGQPDPRHAGIIPALAGNTVHRARPRPRSGDHPRACGEHVAISGVEFAGLGSSPRLRGTLMLVHVSAP